MNNKLKDYWNKFWFLLWKDTSLKGWIFSVIIIFLFIKLIFFPTISFLTGTQLPIAIVESCSMYHQGNFLSDNNEWWENNGERYNQFEIEKETFFEFGFKKGFNKGDILFITGINPGKVKLGDVIIFSAGQTNPVIHRVINITEENGELFFSTWGDNNWGQHEFEKKISENQIIGKARFRLIPYIGWIKLVFYEPLRIPESRGFC